MQLSNHCWRVGRVPSPPISCKRLFAAQADLALPVDLQNFDHHFVALFEHVGDFAHALGASCEICTKPSVPGRISTKAPNSTILRTVPL